MAFDEIYRIGTVINIAVDSSGGAAASTAVFDRETYAIQLNYPGSASSTAGLRVAIGNISEAPVADSTSALIGPAWPIQFKVTPGQRLSVISNDAGKPSLNIIQLTK